MLSRLKIPLPDVVTQVAIGYTLKSLDDKIEQNQRTARALERLARAIFRAWFVDFEPVTAKAAGATAFPSMPQPVFDTVPTGFVESDIGPVPEGWEPGRLGDVIDIHDSRRVPLSKREREQRPGAFRYYGATGILDHVDAYLFDGVFVLVGEDGTVVNDKDAPVVQYVWGQFWVNNHAHVLTGANGISTEHLSVLLDHVNIRPFVTGAVQPKLNQGNLKSVPIVRSDADTAEAFNQTIAPLFAALRQLHTESQALESMRDYLLPKLLSGSIRVGEVSSQTDAPPTPK
jgi:type I restriction enzyme S subunit